MTITVYHYKNHSYGSHGKLLLVKSIKENIAFKIDDNCIPLQKSLLWKSWQTASSKSIKGKIAFKIDDNCIPYTKTIYTARTAFLKKGSPIFLIMTTIFLH